MKSRTLLAVLVGAAVLVAGGIGAWTSASKGAVPTPDPFTAARFELTIDGHSLAVFSELAGISSGYNIEELELITRSGGETLIKPPGKRTPPTVTLRRGLTTNLELSAWHELVLLGDVAAAKKNVTLIAYNAAGEPVARFHLTDAWPAKLDINGLSAGAGQLLMETVTMTCEFIQRVSV